MDPNSFSGKCILSVFDNFVLAVLAALVVVLFQSKSEEYQSLSQQTVAVSKIGTEILTEQRKNLTQAMRNYFLLIEKIKTYGEVPTEEAISELQSLRYEIQMAIYNSAVVDSSIEQDASALLESVKKMNQRLINQPDQKAQIEAEANKVRDEYRAVLKTLRDTAIETIKGEFKIAN
jgi:hypothetical protein